MDELVEAMYDILAELKTINKNLDSIKGTGRKYSMADIQDKLDGIIESVDAVSRTITYK